MRNYSPNRLFSWEIALPRVIILIGLMPLIQQYFIWCRSSFNKRSLTFSSCVCNLFCCLTFSSCICNVDFNVDIWVCSNWPCYYIRHCCWFQCRFMSLLWLTLFNPMLINEFIVINLTQGTAGMFVGIVIEWPSLRLMSFVVINLTQGTILS